MADKSEAIEKAVVTLHQLSEDKKIKLQCEARERYWIDVYKRQVIVPS